MFIEDRNEYCLPHNLHNKLNATKAKQNRAAKLENLRHGVC